MPPRHIYWTIIVDGQATAFRALDPDELLPTFNRLKEKHPSAVMRWFERGRLWESREAAREALRSEPTAAPKESRGKSWRPGGEHRDPREKYQLAKKAKWARFKERIRGKPSDRPAREGPPRPDDRDRRSNDRPQGQGGWKPARPAYGQRREWKPQEEGRPAGTGWKPKGPGGRPGGGSGWKPKGADSRPSGGAGWKPKGPASRPDGGSGWKPKGPGSGPGGGSGWRPKGPDSRPSGSGWKPKGPGSRPSGSAWRPKGPSRPGGGPPRSGQGPARPKGPPRGPSGPRGPRNRGGGGGSRGGGGR